LWRVPRLPGSLARLVAMADGQKSGGPGHRSAGFAALQYNAPAGGTRFAEAFGDVFQ